MSLKETVNQIFYDNTNYLHAQQAVNQARSLKSLSNDLYTDPLRYVYELVQNCDDACGPNSILRIAIVDNRYLIIGHNGKAFDKDDVRGLCDIGCSTKERNEQKTGYKGLGFKAVFGKSDHVLMLSNGEYFRFEANSKVFEWNSAWGSDQSTWEQMHNRKFEFPWQICPIWTERDEVPESIQKWFLGQVDAVATIILLKNLAETKFAIEQLIEQPHVFMFLRNIRTIKFSFNSSKETNLSITTLRDRSVRVIYDWQVKSHWLLCVRDISVPESARRDSRLPEKLQNVNKTQIILAAKIDKNDNIESVQGRDSTLFAYLPTKITRYNLPILVNANFLTNASREYIHTDSAWNQFLFSSIPYEMNRWIGELVKQPKWSNKAFDLIPNPIGIQDDLASKYNQSCHNAATDVPFILSISKELLKASEAVIDVTGFSSPDCIGNHLIRDFILRTYSPKHQIAQEPFICNNKRLRKFKIQMFTWDQCLDMFRSDYFRTNFTPEHNIKFIKHLYLNKDQPPIQAYLRKLPFLMDRMKNLHMLHTVYIPSTFSHKDWVEMNDTDPYIHNDVMKWLKKNPKLLDWLKSLGVTEKTDEIFLRQKVIPNVRNYVTQKTALPIIKKLLHGFQHGGISHDLLRQLNKLKLLSVEGRLVPADELYFSNSYSPRLPLGIFKLDDAKFLSPIYLNQMAGAANKLKEYFLLLGVRDDIQLIRFSEDQHNELVSAYRFNQTMHMNRYNSLQFQNCLTLTFIECTRTNYDFALCFWQRVIDSININYLNEKETLICDQKQLCQVDNLCYWLIRTRACISTSTRQLLKSTDVFSNDLKALLGDLLPVFACNISQPFRVQWQYFFQFKTQLSIQDHIQLLHVLYDRSKNTPINDETEACIQRIYTSMIKCLASFDKRQLDQYRPKVPFYLLSTINNEFRPCIDLAVTLSKDFNLPNQIPQLKLSTGNSRDPYLTIFLDFFNIKQIGINDLALSSNITMQPALFLRAKLRDMQPYLFSLAAARNIKDHCIDNDLEIFEVDQLELFYDDSISVLKLYTHVIGHRLYITKPWNSNQVMSTLPQILCKQYKLPTNVEVDIRQFLLDRLNSSSKMSLSINPSTDLLRIDGTRSKFAMLIDRDNEQLFNHIELTNTTKPSELLIKALAEQHSHFAGYVYHYTHLDNVVSILHDNAIKCRNSLSSNYFKDSAAKHIMQTTRPEVKDYARFYFRPLTATQLCNENLGLPNLSKQYGNQAVCPILIIFRIDLHAILSIDDVQWKISLGNLASPQTEFNNTLDIVKKFDFQGVFADLCTERGKHSSQQEFLVQSQLNFNQLKPENITLIFQDENARYSLERMITHQYLSDVNPSFYFGCNARISIDSTNNTNEIHVSINNTNSSTVFGQFILQIDSTDDNQRIQGNLNLCLRNGETLTFYATNHFSFTTNMNQTRYAIYYECDNQIWLIHTNSSGLRFIPPIQ